MIIRLTYMIDTIRFRIPLNQKCCELLKKKSIETSRYDHKTDNTLFKIYKTDIELGSYDRNINIFFDDKYPDEARVEFSVPKYVFGHNVWLLYASKVEEVIDQIYRNFCNYFGDFPHYSKWEIMRLDICYAWKFESDSIADAVLTTLHSYRYSRKEHTIYDTSIMIKGRTYSLKWYLKHPEYYKHDFKALLLKRHTQYAHEIESTAKGVLRFEATLRKDALQAEFELRRVYIKDITHERVQSVLKKYFKKYFKGATPQFMNTQSVARKLLSIFGKKKAKSLYEFYFIFHSGNKQAINNYLTFVPKRTQQYYFHELAAAGIGLPKKGLDFDFNFDIPSEYAVNQDDAALAVASSTSSRR